MTPFKKKALSIATAAAFAPGLALADELSISGFADVIYYISADAYDDLGVDVDGNPTNPVEGKFSADGEVDFVYSPAEAATVRVDVDLRLADPARDASDDGVDTTGADLEQAYIGWGVAENVTLIGGVFNNPIGADAEDAPDMNFTSHSLVYDVLDGQTALDGNNLAGVAAAIDLDVATVTLGFLNDLGHSDEENSLAAVVNLSPVENLDLELGYVTQGGDDDAGNVVDVNGTYGIAGFTVGLDYLVAEDVVDSVYTIWGGYDFDNGFGVKARFEKLEFESDDELESTTVYGSWAATDNFSVALEWRNDDDGNDDFDTMTLELIGTF